MNDGPFSQLGFINVLWDASNRANILDYSSRKSKRVVPSILGGVIYAFADGFYRAVIFRNDLETIYQMEIPAEIRTESLQI